MSDIKGLAASETKDGSGLRVGIVHTRWNPEIVNALTEGCKQELAKANVTDVTVINVPGAYELPFAAKRMIEAGNFDAIICVGCLIKGETMHFEYICEAVSQGIMRLGLDTGVPVIFGVLTCLTDQQALIRAGLGKRIEGSDSEGHNHGLDWGSTAVEMALLRKRQEF